MRRVLHGTLKGFGWGSGQDASEISGLAPGGPFHYYGPKPNMAVGGGADCGGGGGLAQRQQLSADQAVVHAELSKAFAMNPEAILAQGADMFDSGETAGEEPGLGDEVTGGETREARGARGGAVQASGQDFAARRRRKEGAASIKAKAKRAERLVQREDLVTTVGVDVDMQDRGLSVPHGAAGVAQVTRLGAAATSALQHSSRRSEEEEEEEGVEEEAAALGLRGDDALEGIKGDRLKDDMDPYTKGVLEVADLELIAVSLCLVF